MLHSDACVFALTQISNQFGCEHGQLVTRREGPDIACKSESMRQQCALVYEQLKQVGLNAFGYDDDLEQVPHGTWVKIQFGGLLGLQTHLEQINSNEMKVENIASLIGRAQQQFEQLSQLPYLDYVPMMQSYRTRRRRK